jgi:hypothetical protein
MRWAEISMGEMRYGYKILLGAPKHRRLPGTPLSIILNIIEVV